MIGRSTSAVLRDRNVKLAIFAHAISILGDRMVAVALAFAVLEVGGSASDIGIVLACASIPLVASVLVGGVVADRLSRRAVMVSADLVRVVSQGTSALLLLAGTGEIWMLAALAAVSGLGTGFFNPAATGLLPSFVGEEDLQKVNGVRASFVSVGEIAGPALAGVLVAAFGAGVAIAVDAATFAFSAVALGALRLAPHVPSVPSSFLADLRGGWTAFASRRWVWTFVAYFAVANLMWAAWAALGPVIASESLGGAAAWGFILAAMGLGTLVGSVIATRVDPHRPLIIVALAEGAFALPLALLAAGGPAALIAGAAFVSGGGMMVGMSVWESTLQRQIPSDSISRVSSYDWFGSFAFYPLGLVLWGPISAALGASTTLWIAFGSMAACIVALLLVVPDTRLLTRTKADPGLEAATTAAP